MLCCAVCIIGCSADLELLAFALATCQAWMPQGHFLERRREETVNLVISVCVGRVISVWNCIRRPFAGEDLGEAEIGDWMRRRKVCNYGAENMGYTSDEGSLMVLYNLADGSDS